MPFINPPATVTSNKSPAYKRQETEWKMINTLLGGTKAMRDANTTYLPPHESEHPIRYKKRLAKAVLAPFFKRAVNFAAGKVFYRPVTVASTQPKGELSAKMQAVIADANRRNDSLNKFCHTAFRDPWAKGLGYIYVEADASDTEQVRTEADLLQADIRPYLLYLKPEELLDVEIDGDGQIIYAKILEYYTDFSESTLTTVERSRIRLVTREWIAIYEQKQIEINASASKKIGSYVYEFKESMSNAIGRVPLVPIYAGQKDAEFEATSALIDLAYTNVQYFQCESTHQASVETAEFPMLAGKGKKTDIEIGSHKVIWIPVDGDLFYVEHSGAALEAGRKNLEDLRVKAAYCGLKALASDSATQRRQTTATEAEMNYIDTNSDLKVAADAFADALNMALWYVQRYLGEVKDEEQATVKASLNGMFAVTANDVQELVALMELESAGKMKLEALYKEMKRRGSVSDDFDIDSQVAYAELYEEDPEGV